MASFLRNLGLAVFLPQEELLPLIRSAPHRYKVFKIPKRKKGEFRTIAQPAKEVKTLQYWVMQHVLSQFDVHPAATAYKKGMSIAHNARPHTRGRYLLKLDFNDFFPSIKARDFRLFLRKQPKRFNATEIEALCRNSLLDAKRFKKLTIVGWSTNISTLVEYPHEGFRLTDCGCVYKRTSRIHTLC